MKETRESTEQSRKILLIAYHFPPSAAVGGARLANLARCLPAFGWEPHVLTIRESDIEKSDPARSHGLEHLAVARVRVLPTLEVFGSRIWAMWRRRKDRPAAASAASAAPDSPRPQEEFSRKVRRYVLSFLELPDRERGWIIPATAAAIGRMRRYRIGWFMTSCPPYSAHLVGLLLKTLYGGKWVADFRDPWMTTGSKRLYPTSALSRRIERWLERKVIERADLILFNVQRLRNAYRERYRHVAPEKFAFLPNALPSPVSADRELPEKFATFTICYTGSIYLGRSPEPVYAALQKLIRERRIEPDMVQVKLVGDCHDTNGVSTSAVAAKYGLEAAVQVSDAISHSEAIRLVKRSHLALLLAPNTPFQIPAKVYDYLAAGTRILALAEEGGTADFIRDTGSGRALSPNDVDGIADFLNAEIDARGANGAADPSSLARLGMQSVTEDFVTHLCRSEATSVMPG